jgi:anaerobic selenocysteine-containing dehydrogenase
MAKKGNVSGFRAWKNDLLENYTVESVAETTGVSAEIITELAKGFGAAERPIALYGRGKGTAAGSLREIAAVTVLNALSGNINEKGGLWAVAQPDYIDWPNVNTDKIADAGLAQPRLDGAGVGPTAGIESIITRLAGKVNGEGTYPLQALLVANANPCHALPDTESVKKALSKIPFIVSFSSFQDETAAMADLLMPDHVYLEKYEDVPVGAGLVKQVIGLSKPVVSAQYNTKHLGETLINTANLMGEAIASAFPWENYETCLEETLGNKWDTLMDIGFWEESDVDTVAKKVRPAALDAPSIQAQGDVNSFPLLLVPFDTIRISSGYVGDTPFMVKTVADTMIKGKDGFVEINPQTASANGLKEGALATLTTPVGEASVRVHLYEGIKPGVIAMARGLGHTAYDGYVADKGVNVNELIGPVEDPSSGLDAAWGIRAKLDKA